MLRSTFSAAFRTCAPHSRRGRFPVQPGQFVQLGPQRAAPDGYTLLLHNMGIATAPALYSRLGVWHGL